MYELNARYGWSKFIIVVPSIAIREGVAKSFQITAEHFKEEYGKACRYFKREAVKSLCEEFGVSPAYVENVRVKCNKAIRKNIPGVNLCDFSEERWSALVELSLAFL
jgi:restriction endonuclease